MCQHGVTARQGKRTPEPIGPDTLAHNIVQWHLWDLEGVFKGTMRALAKAGGSGAQVTAIMDGSHMETTERYGGRGDAPGAAGTSRPVRSIRWSCASGTGGTMGPGQTAFLTNASVEQPCRLLMTTMTVA